MSTKSPLGLRQWIWRAFVQSALVPLVLVETALIAIYLLTNNAIRDAQIEHLRETALTDLKVAANLESRVIDEQLGQISALTELYRNLTARALEQEPPAQRPGLALSADGVRYTPRDEGGAAVFYANSTPAERQDLDKVARLSRLDPLMKELQARHPLVASLYFNSWDSLNHIYPWFLTPDQYPHDMVIPNYNFYYLADAEHNPAREVVWTDVYLDPAGHGWMMSAIAPVYRGDFLEGVSGVDITVSGILEQIGQLHVPWNGYAMLVSRDLNIMALPQDGEATSASTNSPTTPMTRRCAGKSSSPRTSTSSAARRPASWPRRSPSRPPACSACSSAGGRSWWPGTPSTRPAGTCWRWSTRRRCSPRPTCLPRAISRSAIC